MDDQELRERLNARAWVAGGLQSVLQRAGYQPVPVATSEANAITITVDDSYSGQPANYVVTVHRSTDQNAAVPPSPPYVVEDEHVVITYKNHRGETAIRRIRPLRMFYGSTEWHPEPQWLLEAHDFTRVGTRTFAMKNISQWVAYNRPA